ncbi:BRO-N domain-containing protein [Parabacteroides sp.]
MTKKEAIKIFEEKKVRTLWDDETEEWYFSVVDVVSVLTDSVDPAAYWRKLKQRLKEEGNETVTNCHGLKMPASDGKMRVTDVATTEQLFRLIQSIPSPKAEPFKLWMAQVAKEKDPQHFEEHAQIAQQGGKAAEAARRQLESDLGHSVVSPLNAKSGLRLEKGKSEE